MNMIDEQLDELRVHWYRMGYDAGWEDNEPEIENASASCPFWNIEHKRCLKLRRNPEQPQAEDKPVKPGLNDRLRSLETRLRHLEQANERLKEDGK